MIRKRLNIIFFSVLMLAVTPRVMSNFNSYTDALYQKAESEWLHFLVGSAHAEESEKNTAAPTQGQEKPTCLQSADSPQHVITKPVLEAKKNPRSTRSRIRSFDFTLAIAPTVASDLDTAVDDSALDWQMSRHVNRNKTQRFDPLAVDHSGRSKTEYVKILIRSLKLRDGKAVRLLQRELDALVSEKTPSIASASVSIDDGMDQSREAESDVTCDTIIVQDASDVSTLDAQ